MECEAEDKRFLYQELFDFNHWTFIALVPNDDVDASFFGALPEPHQIPEINGVQGEHDVGCHLRLQDVFVEVDVRMGNIECVTGFNIICDDTNAISLQFKRFGLKGGRWITMKCNNTTASIIKRFEAFAGVN